MTRGLDLLLDWLMKPRIRRVRRWSFAVTVPVAAVVAHVFGVQHGALVLVVRIALWAAVALVAWRLGGPRGEALRDLLMHPRVRAFARAEADVITAVPRLLVARCMRRGQAGGAYHRGSFGVAVGLAFTPAVLAEAVVVHLLLYGSWVAWAMTGLHAYMLLWLWGYALGPRAFPHRIGARTAVLRNGPMYRVCVPMSAIVAADARTERIGDKRGLTERDGVVLLPARGRVDVWLQLAEPVRIQRPLHEPVHTRRLAVASDDPERLAERLLAPSAAAHGRRRAGLGLGLGLLGALEAAGVVRDAAQPA
jgi:hypothetical protein